jgi:predicted dehydrogenase
MSPAAGGTIAVIGAGQLGSRHLQGLARSACAFDVVVVDPNTDALDVARKRHDEIAGPVARTVRYETSPAALPERIDLAIVATTASVRRRVVQDLLARCRVRYAVLEKVLVQRPDDLDALEEALAQHGTRAWVNCPRRLWDSYRRLRAPFAAPGLSMRVEGGFWGVACNAIHFVDLLAFLTGARVSAVDTRGLDGRWYESKREGYQEIAGSLTVEFDDGGRLVFTSDAQTSAPITITLHGRAGHATIVEKSGRAQLALGSSVAPADTEFRTVLQSELTDLVAQEVLATGSCALTPYAESAAMHRPFLDALLAWSRDTLGQRLDALRIT